MPNTDYIDYTDDRVGYNISEDNANVIFQDDISDSVISVISAFLTENLMIRMILGNITSEL